jgi:hypothetical protein
MKNQIFTTLIIAMALIQFSTSKGNAQSRAACTPVNGYWVLVSNINIKKETTVQFYNNAHQLVYEEVVKGQKMDLSRLKTLRCLKRGLDSALIAYNRQNKALYNKDWVAMNLKH